MNRQQFIYSFQFDDHFSLYQQIKPVPAIQMYFFIEYWKNFLSFYMNSR